MNNNYLLKIFGKQSLYMLIQNYYLGEKIGMWAQGHGTVVKATHTRNKAVFALKIVNNITANEYRYLEQKLFSEIQILEQINKQTQYAIKYVDRINDRNMLAVIYQYCDRGALSRIIEQEGKISEKQAVIWLKQIIQGLQALWKKRLAHRSLETRNIFLNINSIRLTHFHNCRTEGEKLFLKDVKDSSFFYLAPQILQGQPYTIKSDIWSLGIILYELVFGRCPFQFDKFKDISYFIKIVQLTEPFFPPNSGISKPLQDFIKKCLIKNPQQRIKWEDISNIYQITDGEIFSKEIISFLTGGELRSSIRGNTAKGLPQRFNQNYNPSYRNTLHYISSPQMTQISSPKGFINQVGVNQPNISSNMAKNFFINKYTDDKKIVTNRQEIRKPQEDLRNQTQIGDNKTNNQGNSGNSNKSSSIVQQHIKKSVLSQKTQSSHTPHQLEKYSQGNTKEEKNETTSRIANTRLDIITKNHNKFINFIEIVLEMNYREHQYAQYMSYLMFKNLYKQIQQLQSKLKDTRSLQIYDQMKNILKSQKVQIDQLIREITSEISNNQQIQNNQEIVEAFCRENKQQLMKNYTDKIPKDEEDVRLGAQVIDYLVQGILIKRNAYERMNKEHLMRQMKNKTNRQVN